MKRLVALAVALLALLPASTAFAQEGDDNDKDGLLLRIDGDLTIGAGQTIDTVVVISGDLTIEGTVTDAAVVIEGNAIVTSGGKVEDSLTVISGDINLRSGAEVHDLNSIRGDLIRAAGATVTGDVNERDNVGVVWGTFALFTILFWIAMTIAVVVAGLVFAAVGGRQLRQAARVMTGDAVNTVVGVVCVWVGLPILAVLAIVTLVGLALGLGLLIFLLPSLWFLGYIVAGTRLGTAIVGGLNRPAGDHPFLAAAVGLIILQLIILVPVIGGIIVALLGVWGAGALAFVAYQAAGGKGFGGSISPAEAPV